MAEEADHRRTRGSFLHHNLKVASAVSFLQDAASELIYPVLPFLVTSLLGGSAAALGAIEGLADATAAVVKVAGGRLSDRRSRRPLVGLGYSISSAGKVVLAAATTIPVVGVARFADRVGKGLRGPPRDALIAEDTTEEDRGRSFGFHRMADTAGAVVGPLLGLALYEALGHRLRLLLWVAVVPAVASAALTLLLRERARPHGATVERLRASLPPRFWRLMAVVAAFSIVNFPDALLLLRAKDLGAGFAGVTLVYVLYNLVYAGLSYPAGLVSDRLGRRRVYGVGMLVFAVAYLGFGFTSGAGWVWVVMPVYGAYTALTDGVSRAWVADLVPAGSRGTALGVHAAITGIGLLVAGVWAGLAWHGTGHVPFLVSGAVAAVLAVGLLVAGSTIDPA